MFKGEVKSKSEQPETPAGYATLFFLGGEGGGGGVVVMCVLWLAECVFFQDLWLR